MLTFSLHPLFKKLWKTLANLWHVQHLSWLLMARALEISLIIISMAILQSLILLDLARGIQHIISLSNYHYREYCNAARKSAVQNFSYVSVSSKYIELYRKLLNQ